MGEFQLVEAALTVHCLAVSMLLLVIGLLLLHAGKFNWMSGGFWVWVSCLMVFVVHPLVAMTSNQVGMYVDRLANTDGPARVYWVLVVILLGVASLFLGYFVTTDAKPLRGLELRPSIPVIFTMCAFLLMSFYSIFTYRYGERLLENGAAAADGKFGGDVTGWETSMHRFSLFPIAYLLIYRRTRLFGILVLLAYTAARMFDPDDRLTIVTPFLALVLILMAERCRTWPTMWMVGLVAAIFAILMFRGHDSINDMHTHGGDDNRGQIEHYLAGPDADMLSQCYRLTDLRDQMGYTYGLTFVQSACFGYLPRKYFPWKDHLFDEYIFNPWNQPRWTKFICGPKSTIIGCGYSYGSIIGVLIVCPIAGWLCRKADGLMNTCQPPSVRAAGAIYMSLMFMFFMSDPEWTLQYFVVIAIPLGGAIVVNRLTSVMNWAARPDRLRIEGARGSLSQDATGAIIQVAQRAGATWDSSASVG